MRLCAVIPTFNHVKKLSDIAHRLNNRGIAVVIVDDGSRSELKNQISALQSNLTTVLHHTENRGKGQALTTGFRYARERQFTHALQLDADGQHDLDDVEKFVEAATLRPTALVLGCPIFDESAPRARVWGRKLSVWLVWLETLGFSVLDPLCGFRVYPLETTLGVIDAYGIGERMDFDPEIAVRLVWEGTPTVNIPTKVEYSDCEHSNFDYCRDNLRMITLHFKLLFERLLPSRNAQIPRHRNI